MYLKKLELYGFKTFADKTEIEFTPGITCIVGPNGSGKSNIADAVRWVLGEQSIKSLRSSSLEEVIFAGSEKRKPLNMAQIILTIDNSSGKLPIEYTEVSILRRTFRDGESEYFINKTPCRLKDIQELFFDTGLGKNTYSLVNQGEVDFILTSKPEERRLILEEAAGVSKFKHKKKEALKKLENTKINLIRLKDIVAEINNQLLPLKEQADKARKYQQIKEKLQKIEIDLKGNQIIQNRNKCEDLKREIEILKQKQEEKNGDIEFINSQKNSKIAEIEKLKNLLSEFQKTSSEFNKILEEKKTEIAVKREKINSLYKQKELNFNILKELENKIEEINKEKENKSRELKEIENLLSEKEKFLEENENLFQTLENEIKIIEKDIESKKSEVIEVIREITKNNNEISYFKNMVRERRKIIEKLGEEKKRAEENFEEVKSEIEKINSKIQNTKEEIEDLKLKIKEITEKEINKREEKLKLEEKIEELKLKLESLKNLSQLREEFLKFQPVKILLEEKNKQPEKFLGVVGELSSLFKTETEFEKAVRKVIGDYLHYLIVENISVAREVVNYIKEKNIGKVGIFSLDLIPEKNTEFKNYEGLERLIDKIEYPERLKNLFEFLFKNVFLRENLELENVKKIPEDIKVISSTGELFYSDGTLIVGSEITSSEIEKYFSDISSLFKEIEELNSKLEFFTKEREKIELELKEISLNKDELEKESKEKEISLLGFERDIVFLNKSREEIEKEISLILKEIEDIEREISKLEEKINIFNDTLKTLDKKKEEIEKVISEAQKFYIEKNKDRENLINSNTSLQIEIASLKQKAENIKNFLENSEIEIEKLKEQILSKEKEDKNFQESLENLEKTLQEEILNLGKQEEEKNLKELEINNIFEEINLKEKEVKIYEEKIEELKREYSDFEKKLHSFEIEITALQTETQEIVKRISEEYNLNPEEIILKCEKVEDEENSLKEIKRLKSILDSLGTVNPLAIEEYERQKERFDFLNKQKEDLEEAREELLKFIKDIDAKTKKTLLETFQEIQKNFDLIFKQLFEGGEAKLILLDESNILETGIDIEVKLPGKRIQNISLLSGGEKTLVAIALLFAILKVRPSPFCILDEIDAALDEINVEKFKKLLSEFSKETQFIIITHNKGTMETADTLYGVTMEEEGISKLVSVRIQDIVNNE